MKSFSLEIITPDRHVPPRDVTALNVPAEHGRLTVLAGHAPLLCGLRDGSVTFVTPGDSRETVSIGEGILIVEANRAKLVVSSLSELPATP